VPSSSHPNDVLHQEGFIRAPALSLKGWVKAEWGQSEAPPCALLSLTPSGRRQLQKEVADFEKVMEGILRLMRPARGE
jgi:hypothetical protein